MDIGEEETDDGLEPEYRHIVRPAVQPLREDGDRQARSPGIDPSDGPTYLLTQRSTAHLITQQSSQQGQRPPKYCCPSLCGPKRIICCVVCCWLLPFILAGLGVAGFYLYPRTNIDVHIGSFRQHITHYDATAAVLPTFAVTLLTTLNISNPNYVPFTLTSIQLKVWYVARPAAGVAAAAVSLNPATSGISTGVPLVIINSASDIVVPAGTPDAPQHKTFLVKVSLSTNNGEYARTRTFEAGHARHREPWWMNDVRLWPTPHNTRSAFPSN